MRAIDQLKRSENIRKIFGKRELIIIEKQLLGIKLTQSERNRLSRDIRKKFEAIKEVSLLNIDFKLKHGLETKKSIEEAKIEILNKKNPKVSKIILFGSTADNTRTLKSDIDIAIEFNSVEREEAMKFRLDVIKKLNANIDIQIYNFLPDKLKKEIDTKGKVIYEKKN